MESTDKMSKQDSSRESSSRVAVNKESEAVSNDSLFRNEIYWFLILGLGAWIVLSVVLPPRTVETIKLMKREKDTLSELHGALQQEQALLESIEAMENDPFYQEAI